MKMTVGYSLKIIQNILDKYQKRFINYISDL